MKYPWLAAITTLLSAGAADITEATTYKDIAGQWCGESTDYVFAPSSLTVKFHDGRPAEVFKIAKYTHTNQTIISRQPQTEISRFMPQFAQRA